MLQKENNSDIVGSAPKKTELFTKLVLEWANGGLRDFPWRMTKNPYKILIAEIMLQRTKANQVAPVFERFIKTLVIPGFKHLSTANVRKQH